MCAPHAAGRVQEALLAPPSGRGAQRIGEVVADAPCFVRMRTRLGGTRMVDWRKGEHPTNIC